MLTIRPSKMLARRLGVELSDQVPEVRNRLADWCAHEFRAGRHLYLMLCHTGSLYPVVTPMRGVTDSPTLVRRIDEALRLNLKGPVLEALYSQGIATEIAEVQFVPIPDRRVMGTMNELIFAAKIGLAEDDMALTDLSPWLAVTPLSILGMNSPDCAIAQFGDPIQRGR